VADPSPVVEVSEHSLAVEMLEPPPAAGAVGSSSAINAVTVEEVMGLATCRYIDFPGVGVIDLEAPQLSENVLEVATERMFIEPSIMDTIASVSKALREYERVGGFAPVVAAEATDVALEAPAASMEPTADASVPPLASERQEVSLPQPAEAAEVTAAVAATGAAEAIVGEAGSLPPRPVMLAPTRFALLMSLPPPSKREPLPRVQQGLPPQRSKRSRRRGRPCLRSQQAVKPRPSSLPAPRGRPFSGPTMTPRTTRRLRCATPWSMG
jgi:hypothetical protein